MAFGAGQTPPLGKNHGSVRQASRASQPALRPRCRDSRLREQVARGPRRPRSQGRHAPGRGGFPPKNKRELVGDFAPPPLPRGAGPCYWGGAFREPKVQVLGKVPTQELWNIAHPPLPPPQLEQNAYDVSSHLGMCFFVRFFVLLVLCLSRAFWGGKLPFRFQKLIISGAESET